MKVKIKDLKPNPYRDMENYPIDRGKIETLKASILLTGFWDNIIARKSNGNIQIAYGHHRLITLREMMKPNDVVDIPIKDLSDALMIKIMARENDTDWKTNVAVTNETVRVAKEFLKQHPEEIKTKNPIHRRKAGNTDDAKIFIWSPLAFQIHEFLGWGEHKVYDSLVLIEMIENEEIEKEVIESMPHETAANRFVSQVVKKGEMSIVKQRKIAERLHKEDSFGEQVMKDAVIIEKYTTPKKKQEYQNEKIIEFENYSAGIRNKADDLLEDLRHLIKVEKELGQYTKGVHRKLLDMSLNSLSKQIDLIIKKQENEKTEFRKSNLNSIEG